MDSTAVGRVAAPFAFEVERSKVRELARATGSSADDHLHGPAPCAPPTFFTTMFGWMEPEHDPWTFLGIDPLRSLHVSQEYEFPDGPPLVGARYVGQSAVESIRRSRVRDGRVADFVVIRTDFSPQGDGSGRPVCSRLTVAEWVDPGAGAAAPGASGVPTATPAASPAPVGTAREPGGVPSPDLPVAPPERTVGPLTLLDFVRYEGASGHFNPVHFDHEAARRAGAERPFAVGMLLAGYLAAWATDWLGPRNVRRVWFRFRRQVWLGDEVRVGGRATRWIPGRRVGLELACATVSGDVAVGGGAVFAC